MNSYDLGQTVRCAASFTDTTDGSLRDPTSVTIRVKHPNGNEEDLTVVHDGTGLYHGDIGADESGTWHYRALASGSYAGAGEASFQVNESAFA